MNSENITSESLIDDSAVTTCAKPCHVSFSPEYIEKIKRIIKVNPTKVYNFFMDLLRNYRPELVSVEVKKNIEQAGSTFSDIGYRNLVCHHIMDHVIPSLGTNQGYKENLVKAMTPRFNFRPTEPLMKKINAFNAEVAKMKKEADAARSARKTTVADTPAGTVLRNVKNTKAA